MNYIEILEMLRPTLESCTHSYNGRPNKYHLEDDCYTHTKMVVNEMERIIRDERYKPYNENEKVLMLSAIFHDIGKPYTATILEDKQRKIFQGHDYMSALLYLDFAKKLPTSREEDELIAKLVFYHLIIGKDREALKYFDFYPLLELLFLADQKGRITAEPKPIVEPTFETKHLPLLRKYKNLYLLFGLPGSGKSTFVRDINFDYIISRDALIEEYAEREGLTYMEAYRVIHNDQQLLNELEQRFNQMLKEAREYRAVAVDMMNLTKKGRRIIISRFKKTHNIHTFIFLAPFSEIVKRNQQREGKDLSHKLINLVRKTTVPSFSEGIDRIFFLFT